MLEFLRVRPYSHRLRTLAVIAVPFNRCFNFTVLSINIAVRSGFAITCLTAVHKVTESNSTLGH